MIYTNAHIPLQECHSKVLIFCVFLTDVNSCLTMYLTHVGYNLNRILTSSCGGLKDAHTAGELVGQNRAYYLNTKVMCGSCSRKMSDSILYVI